MLDRTFPKENLKPVPSFR
jgi:hypothetical protein